eukprot:9197683-Lingulodinium_polyedra.AAC.1
MPVHGPDPVTGLAFLAGPRHAGNAGGSLLPSPPRTMSVRGSDASPVANACFPTGRWHRNQPTCPCWGGAHSAGRRT